MASAGSDSRHPNWAGRESASSWGRTSIHLALEYKLHDNRCLFLVCRSSRSLLPGFPWTCFFVAVILGPEPSWHRQVLQSANPRSQQESRRPSPGVANPPTNHEFRLGGAGLGARSLAKTGSIPILISLPWSFIGLVRCRHDAILTPFSSPVDTGIVS